MASLLAGYISGSSVDLARVIEQKGSGVRLVGRQTYTCSDFSNFDSILKLYLRRTRSEFSVACFGVAGVDGLQRHPTRCDARLGRAKGRVHGISPVQDLAFQATAGGGDSAEPPTGKAGQKYEREDQEQERSVHGVG